MNAKDLLYSTMDAEGWTVSTALEVALGYIESLGDGDAERFSEYLLDVASGTSDEDEDTGRIEDCYACQNCKNTDLSK